MWFNVLVILDQPVSPNQQAEEQLRDLAEDLMAHYADGYSEEGGGTWDRMGDVGYGPISQYKPEATHAILTPEGIWLDNGDTPHVETSLADFPELNKFHWERDPEKMKEELARLEALEKPLYEAREAKWQRQVKDISEKFADRHVLWVRCHF